MSSPADPGRMILRGGRSAAAGFVVRFGARITFLVIAGTFGAPLFGAYVLAVATVELAVSLGGLGTKKLVFQLLDERADRPAGHVLIDAAVMVGGFSLLLGLIIAAFAAGLPASFGGANTARALVVLAPMIAGQAILDLMLAATRWKHRMRYEVIGRSIVEPYTGLAVLLFAYFAGYRESGLLLSYWIGTLAALLYSLVGIRRCFGSLQLASYRLKGLRAIAAIRSTSLNTATDVLNALFGRIDLYVVGVLLGESAAGIYGMARQVRLPIRQVRQSFDGLLTPLVAKTLQARGPENTGRAIASAARLILALQLPILIALLAMGIPLLNWFGPGFAAGYWAMIMLAAAETVQGAFGVGDLIFVYRKPELGLRITFLSVLIGLGSGFVLTWLWEIDGAAASVLLTFLARAFARRVALNRHFGIRAVLGHSSGPLVAAALGVAALTAALVLMREAPALLASIGAAAVGIIIYMAVLRIWLSWKAETLALSHFAVEAGDQLTSSKAIETR